MIAWSCPHAPSPPVLRVSGAPRPVRRDRAWISEGMVHALGQSKRREGASNATAGSRPTTRPLLADQALHGRIEAPERRSLAHSYGWCPHAARSSLSTRSRCSH